MVPKHLFKLPCPSFPPAFQISRPTWQESAGFVLFNWKRSVREIGLKGENRGNSEDLRQLHPRYAAESRY